MTTPHRTGRIRRRKLLGESAYWYDLDACMLWNWAFHQEVLRLSLNILPRQRDPCECSSAPDGTDSGLECTYPKCLFGEWEDSQHDEDYAVVGYP